MTAPVPDEHRDAHLINLRLALGSIVAPKRPAYARSPSACGTSGTATPAHHSHPHHHRDHRVPSPPSSSSSPSSSVPASPEPAAVPLPVPVPVASQRAETVPAPATSPAPPTTKAVGSAKTRVGLVGTLQSKSAFDALVHGSWV